VCISLYIFVVVVVVGCLLPVAVLVYVGVVAAALVAADVADAGAADAVDVADAATISNVAPQSAAPALVWKW